jgi:uncharacterized phage protein gp47/JayE
MPWVTPTLRKVREMVRDDVAASLYGSTVLPNGNLRIMGDANAGLAHHVLRFIEWLARQLMPDLAETEWLDRHADIWLVGPDGSGGRKMATYAAGIVELSGTVGGVVIPAGSRLESLAIFYETTEEIVTLPDAVGIPTPVRALDPGAIGNMEAGETMSLMAPPEGANGTAVVATMIGGTDTETDDDLRMRVLQRIRQPPQGGAAHDYVRWALAVPGVTRAWCAPLEMGIGTVTVRVLFDVLRADDDGWPRQEDLETVEAYIDTQRPVAVKDFWVLAPVKQFVDVKISNLVPDNTEIRSAVEDSLHEMFYRFAAPGQTIFATWKAQAVMNTAGVISFDLLDWQDDTMQSPGHMGVLHDIVYGTAGPANGATS